MKVKKISPRGYCYGVVDAMKLANEAVANPDLPRPIHILGMIVHNRHVTQAFEDLGVQTVDGEDRMKALETIDRGTVVFTAHGISPLVRKRAIEKGLTIVDASCPDVLVTHDLIREKTALGYEVIYIGKHGHPEPEGAMGVAPGKVHLVQYERDFEALPDHLYETKILVTNQTTMSQWDVSALIEMIQERYPHVEVHNEICNATQVRQEAVAEQAGDCELLIVVGDPKSNNSNRLAQVSKEIAGTNAYRIGDLSELDLAWLDGVETVAVTSGASTPTPITKKVIDFLTQYDPLDLSTHDKTPYLELRSILPKVKALRK
ncbi:MULTISPECIES: 4-hydroxy-3-methylbut-2-enyl diphosphate reductase [Exiguobacterium]|uniref:4-hydroxy-3-methylbut-2-enyl diphosphate reductase n=1 Tax=Exiguobacterium TaxID=33986 RepID=UPI001BE7115F|nr:MULTISPECIES: 4-hydroxy-3-methylbut-2-enyl diphosphate reductase [Exiguobacterium]MCT4778188.1 4-hydroxy-3-methylbut-2-enyl diphosphate reductase [Exiguobacterium aquaticum]MCT4788187.1 4-hydroxy-3-methylbut-2-enyl diphosphate reductase [Exiguobacterium mexicanum]